MAGRDNPFKPPEDTTYTKETTKVNPGDVLKATVEEVAIPVTQGQITYRGDAALLAGGGSANGTASGVNNGRGGTTTANTIIDQKVAWDIAQSHFFTVQIYSPSNKYYPHPTGLHDKQGKAFAFASGHGVWENYIPIKSMSFNYVSYDNMSIPVNILGDFPLLNKKRVTVINFSCYDMDDDRIELALKYWEDQCFPGSYVEYLDNIKAKLTYTSYDVTGRKNFIREIEVIPSGTVSVSRAYDENAAKILNFSVIAVGVVGASIDNMSGMARTGRNGRGGSAQEIAEIGYGDGSEYKGLLYERNVKAVIPGYDEKYKVQVT